LWRFGSGLALFLPVRTARSLVRVWNIDFDLDSEEGVIAREEGPLLRVKEGRARAMGYLRREGRPHLHELVTGRRSGESKLSLAVEVEFPDEMETCVSAG